MQAGSATMSCESDMDGRYAGSGLRPGDWDLRVSSSADSLGSSGTSWGDLAAAHSDTFTPQSGVLFRDAGEHTVVPDMRLGDVDSSPSEGWKGGC
jgi:hypothetical protein